MVVTTDCLMDPENYTLPVLLFFNMLVLITYPVHVIFVISLFRNRYSSALGTPFHHLLLSVGISDLVSATGYLLLQEPAWLGLAPDFYLRNAWWIAKKREAFYVEVVNICGIAVSNVPIFIHFFLAVNRLTAVRLPAEHYHVVNICGIAVSNVPIFIHFFLAVNRLTAVRLPAEHYHQFGDSERPCESYQFIIANSRAQGSCRPTIMHFILGKGCTLTKLS
ncbi:hypothetical protein ANCDUO_04290 [Ancylostoma duodenale]|uniref:Uncharacterized protein n=1 Tax=Ancylostoma duodenale TaxID=51022 RepID=A0A0C2H1I5_9BILA|nr:hypothetical protein ANCDUO_04290 [Ancylostoma duodenale]